VPIEGMPTAAGPDVLPNPMPAPDRSLPSPIQRRTRHQFRPYRNRHLQHTTLNGGKLAATPF
jgi:hypothetical protein